MYYHCPTDCQPSLFQLVSKRTHETRHSKPSSEHRKHCDLWFLMGKWQGKEREAAYVFSHPTCPNKDQNYLAFNGKHHLLKPGVAIYSPQRQGVCGVLVWGLQPHGSTDSTEVEKRVEGAVNLAPAVAFVQALLQASCTLN